MNDRPEKPAYQQVSEHLRTRIGAGEFPAGSQLPSMAMLMEQYTASATVIRMALRELRSAGIVSTRQGKGAFVLATSSDGGDQQPSSEFQMLMLRLDRIQDGMRQMEQRLAALEAATPLPGGQEQQRDGGQGRGR